MEKTALATIEIVRGENKNMHFYPDFLIVYGLRGTSMIISGKNHYELHRGGILTIAPFLYHSFRCGEDGAAAVLHITQEMLRVTAIAHQLSCVRCHISDDSSGIYGEYDNIRMYFARIFKDYFQDSPQSDVQLFSHISQMFKVLVMYFTQSEAEDCELENPAAFAKYTRMMTYIHEHWRKDISIKQLAKQEFVSPGYLSRSFKAYTGVTFTAYVMELRLQNAARDLKDGKGTVTEIAYANGFKNANSFIKYFKARYGTTPKQYGKSAGEHDQAVKRMKMGAPEDDGISDLLKYTALDERLATAPPLPVRTRQINACASAKGQALAHTWRNVLNVGYARNILLAEVQNQIRQAQREIGFTYIRFHGILDDDMHVYYEDDHRRPYLDFSRVDLLLDFVVSVGLKPYIEFSYVPKLLAKKDAELFDQAIHISGLNSEENWRALITGILHHCIGRYGRSRVAEWKFTTIGSNCVSTGIVSMEDYLQIYQTSYECVKEADPQLAFGGPGGHSSSIWDSRCIHDFFEYALSHNCVPDFICTECFPHRAIGQDADFMRFMVSQISAPSVLSSDVHYTRTMLRDYRKLLESYGLSHLDIWIEEWNSTFWQRDLSGDTCYKAAWLTKNICENYDETESFGYWTLSDFIEERSDFGIVYHGGYGLVTYNGIPQSGWMAMKLLRMMGGVKLDAGEGWMITRSRQGIQIILNHYCHYDNLYCLRYQKLTDPRKAYSVFMEDGLLKFEIHLTDLPAGEWEIKRFLISPKCGSSFDVWLNMGMPRYLRGDEINYLRNTSQPQYQVETLELTGSYRVESCLAPHEVQMILLDFDSPFQ